ncbi:MAG: hypothetical protein WEB57_00180 [Pseudohongiellaceae bacterium]
MRRFLLPTLALLVMIVAGIPTLNGWWLRHQVTAGMDRLPDSAAFRLEHTGSRARWLDSTMYLRLHGEAINAQEDGVPLELTLSHGPLIWHLSDSPWALATLQLQTPPDYSGPGANRYSGAAVLRVSPGARLIVRGILGGAAFDGDHQVQFSGNWPLLAESNNAAVLGASVTIYLELDAEALQASPAANALRLYERQGWTRISQGRGLTELQLEDGVLTINGQRLSLRGLLAQQ